ncbi:DUF4157 domain-containing protein [Vibrio cionasavignyae]|uniref:eCIS core domain-containing protein n=1 Tax=Vibrio cionasavignyae TaxID=2910252 RepID=UPI003D0E1EAB
MTVRHLGFNTDKYSTPWPTYASCDNWPQAYPGRSLGIRLPTGLRRGMERLTGLDLSKVKVHYNSPMPARVHAHGYAQGDDIYLAQGQEQHLPHELGHVVQQRLGMVQPTTEVNGVAVNDDEELERHATELGNAAIRVG